MVETKMDGFCQADFDALAKLHINSIPKTSFSVIGEKATSLAYSYMAQSNKELLVTATVDGVVCGGIVVSYDPATLTKRILTNSPFRFGMKAAIPLILKINRLPEIFKLLTSVEAPYIFSPEIMFLFTDQALRSKGIGKALVEGALSSLAKNVSTVFVRTIDSDDNRAINFYKNNGFQQFKVVEYLGKKQIIMSREL